MPSRRRAELVLALPNHGQAQANFDTPMAESVLVKAWAMTSDSYPGIEREIDRLLNCTLERLVQKDLLRRIMRFPFDFEANGQLLAQLLAYKMGVAATPTGTQANQVQTLTMAGTGGIWRVGIIIGQYIKYTPYLAWNVSAANLKAAVENLTAIGRNNITVTLSTGVYTVTHINNLARAEMPQYVVDSTLLTGGVATPAETIPGVQKSHALSEITGFQQPAFGFVVGYRNSARLPRRYDSVVVDALRISGAHAQPRLNANVSLVGSGNLNDVTGAYVIPPCTIYRPIRFKDCTLIINGVDYSNQAVTGNPWRDFDLTMSSDTITDDDAYTGQDEDVHRLERADQRPWSLNVGILGEKGDDIYALAEENAEVAVSLQLGRSNECVIANVPRASVTLRNPETQFDGTAKRSKIMINIEPEEIPGDATTPYTFTAKYDETATLLAAA